MPPLARRNLLHDKVRLTVTLTGIVFAVVLIIVQFGLFLGFTNATSGLIKNSGADFWIVGERVPYLERTVEFSERKVQQVRATPGVLLADNYVADFGRWKRRDGQEANVFLLGFNPDTQLGGPWNLVKGRVEDLDIADSVIVDRIYQEKLGVSRIGEVVEINGRRARVVGFTQGIRSFTTSPYVFTSFKNAQRFGGLRADQAHYILVKATAGADLPQLQRDLQARIAGVDVHTTATFANMTTAYWMFTTGAGVAVLIAALLGLVVGVVIVAQTIYATTMDHIREYGTLKAMGATNRYIYRVIIEQAVTSAGIGYVLAMIVSFFVVRGSEQGGAAILLPWQFAVSMLLLTMLMCIAAAMVSINKVTKIDPAMVFKQ